MWIECSACEERGEPCGECFLSEYMAAVPEAPAMDPDQERAVSLLVAGGLTPPGLRLVHDAGPAPRTPRRRRSA